LVLVPPCETVAKEVLNKTREEFDVRHVAKVKPEPLKSFAERVRFELEPAFLNTYYTSVSDADRSLMLHMMNDYDVIWIHTIRTANEFGIYRWPHSVLDVDDIPSRLYDSSARNAPTMIRRLLDYRMSFIWSRRERLVSRRFDVIAVCSENDRRYLNGSARIHTIPNGFTTPSRTPKRAITTPVRIGFIGGCFYKPHREGVEWFIKCIWPLIKREVPDARLRLVGRESDKGLPGMGPDIDAFGYVDDPTDEIATWSVLVVPLRIGGGTRVKIPYAFSQKCPVVATTLGAFGYEVRNGVELLLADSEGEFAEACVRLIRDRDLAARVSENAWERLLREWTWDVIGESVHDAFRSCLRGYARDRGNG
jgi:polysaccharide biosynthesis protein PslH